MTLDDELVKAIDKAVKKLKTTRSTFARQALRGALSNLKIAELEQKHRRGYEMHPVSEMNSRFGRMSRNGVMNETGRGSVV